MAVNDFALHQIAAAQAREPSALMRVLWPWSGAPQTQEVVRARFEDAMAVTGEAISHVVVEAQLSLGHLQELEERLRTLYEIVAREDRALQACCWHSTDTEGHANGYGGVACAHVGRADQWEPHPRRVAFRRVSIGCRKVGCKRSSWGPVDLFLT